jgi:hypothetical protein
VGSYPFFYTEIKSRHENQKPTRSGPFAGHLRLLVCPSVSNLAARCPARVARCPRPRHDRAFLIYCSRHPSSRAPHRYSVPQPQAADQPFKPSAPPRKHCQRPRLVKSKSPQGSRVTVLIKQYLLYSAAQLTSCSFPASTASRLTSSMLPHVSLGASQLLKPASTPPRSYGTAAGIGLGTTSRRRKPIVDTFVDNTAKLRPQASAVARSLQACCHKSQPMRKPTVETCVDTTAELRPQASYLALRAAGANQLLRPASTTPRCYGRRNRSWHHGHVHATHNEQRRGKRPVHHDQVHAWRLGHRHGRHD